MECSQLLQAGPASEGAKVKKVLLCTTILIPFHWGGGHDLLEAPLPETVDMYVNKSPNMEGAL